MGKTRFKFNGKAWGDKLFMNVVSLQSQLLVDYAKRIIVEIGDRIQQFNSVNHMDRTGNLLNSLVWGVTYDGKLIERGFYRNAESIEESYLHEWMDSDISSLFPVNGHERAQQFSTKYARSGKKGWRVFFAVLAPYWGYWESGFTLKSHFGGGSRRMQFQVMTHIFDIVRMDLKPSKVTFSVGIPKYQYKSRKYKGKKGYANLNTLASRMSHNPYAEKQWLKKRGVNRRRRRR